MQDFFTFSTPGTKTADHYFSSWIIVPLRKWYVNCMLSLFQNTSKYCNCGKVRYSSPDLREQLLQSPLLQTLNRSFFVFKSIHFQGNVLFVIKKALVPYPVNMSVNGISQYTNVCYVIIVTMFVCSRASVGWHVFKVTIVNRHAVFQAILSIMMYSLHW